jgi:acetyl-CoA synthetase
MSIESHYKSDAIIYPSKEFCEQATVNSNALHEKASKDRLEFWDFQANKLTWYEKWDKTLQWDRPFSKWFVNGKLNASYNCVDRHLDYYATKRAIIWRGEKGEEITLTYEQLHIKVCQYAQMLSVRCNVKKGDRVTLYMPLVPELAIAVLACARIGAIHSVVFAGFSAQSLRERIIDSNSKCIITADGGYRRGKIIELKQIVDSALDSLELDFVENVLVFKRTNKPVSLTSGRDSYIDELLDISIDDFKPAYMDSEDPLFILYTSGTTGKPKGIVHTTGGYLTHAQYSTKAVFDLKDSDVYWCTADIGWITGHTYLVYGPLLNAGTVFMYEGTPDYPDNGIFWELIQTYKISIFYTAPTAIRLFMKWGEAVLKYYDLSSLRLLGSVGEPINPEAWMWYYTHVGNQNCPVVDTWWQTETGGVMITTLPGLDKMKPGFAGKPLPGISASLFSNEGDEIKKDGGLLSLTEPWPSMARGIWGDDNRFKEVYWSKFDTYFAGDGAVKDKDGYIMVLGRVDDVLNIAGHRIGTMEVESSLVDCKDVAEAAVVGMPDDIKGQALVAFVILKVGVEQSDEIIGTLKQSVVTQIGAIARPKHIICVPDLPKTRSGKIMRRILKNIVAQKEIGDLTSIADPQIVSVISNLWEENMVMIR